jgi:hypothetical protein
MSDSGADEPPHGLAGGALTAGRRFDDLALEAQILQRRELSRLEPTRQWRQFPVRRENRTARATQPGVVKRREYLVGLTGCGVQGRRVIHDKQPGRDEDLSSRALYCALDRVVAPPGEWPHVLAPEHSDGSELTHQLREDPLRFPMPEHQASATPAERFLEIGEALEEKLGPRPRRVAPMQEPIVEAEHGDY